MADILSRTREELYKVSNGSVDWANAAQEEAREYLVQKGYLEQQAHQQLSMAKIALVLLRIVADGGGATANDGLRAVAVMLERRRIDRALDDIRDELTELVDLVAEAAQKTEEKETREDTTTHTLLEAAGVLMRTVDEQVEAVRGATDKLELAASRAADAVLDLREAKEIPSPQPGDEDELGDPKVPIPSTSGQTPLGSYAVVAAKAALHKPQTRAGESGGKGDRNTSYPCPRVAKARLAMEAVRTSMGDDTAPAGSVVVGARVLQSGDVVLQMNSVQAADWQRRNMRAFLEAMGGTSALKHRRTSLVVEYVPTSFDPNLDGALRILEDDNNLGRGAIASARFIKAVEWRHSGQCVAHIILALNNDVSANRIIRYGIFIEGKKVWGRKLLPEPVRCLKCQMIGTGHLADTCLSIHDTCAQCGGMHRTAVCEVSDAAQACSNCRGAKMSYQGHGAADRGCPFFATKLQFSLERNPDAPFKYFLTNDPETWETHREADGRPDESGPWLQGTEWRTTWAASAGKKGGVRKPATPGLEGRDTGANDDASWSGGEGLCQRPVPPRP
ncbi:hypothetical protein C8J57DRAFT_1537679 [Mycena rebaudengoi]|nr:hypothetical protein C8J57DRAFT_1537679 [Mycena rebaudengoi]